MSIFPLFILYVYTVYILYIYLIEYTERKNYSILPYSLFLEGLFHYFLFLLYKVPSDVHLYRFLKARDFQVEKAREMLFHSLSFRKKHSVDKLLDTYQPSPVIAQYYAGGWHYHDKGNEISCIFVLYLSFERSRLFKV